ncbi:unnamed protein product [Caenorhabditis bovis]|uniref:Uncharacterized protein n=1 Tax=Caenorhabditis bovis TaxID=2654633 RepID=A0A8S1EZP7_9PELO|nr:unnamed protein product [Caenorhabditis bovis]
MTATTVMRDVWLAFTFVAMVQGVMVHEYGTPAKSGLSRLKKLQTTAAKLHVLEPRITIKKSTRSILERLENGAKLKKSKRRRMHGVRNFANFDKKPKFDFRFHTKQQVDESPKTKEMERFENELAEQIEKDQLKFVEDEKNPLKYVVDHGLLYKQSRFAPIARL